MKKIISILLVFTLLLTACSPAIPPDEKTRPDESAVNEAGEVVIYLTRHGKTMLNTTERVQGWADSPLTEAGVEVAQQLGRGLNLEGVRFVAAYSSDSGRAIETANIVLEQGGQFGQLELNQMKELREWNFGIFEGDLNDHMIDAVIEVTGYKGEEDVRSALDLSELADAIAKADETGAAENWEQISGRTDAGFRAIAQEVSENGGGNVLVVAHGLTINAIVKNINPGQKTVPIANAAVTKIKYVDGKFEILTFNDTSYIEKGAE
ncbi:histidine phosphatase family protein [Paenibacillus thiaminolyticus]|uniref:Histidine phosphatase family protein n=1 Tax=Paenibacillus thiaminolyticus TaxID=49283 RepID=A0A3A3GFX6_PANTH|nr:histidine phosphatase family protein [Paenibacillus thiaminolyticus]RJG22759.1 histidine phosphatase family protein [Paenibacillus thiaminolyticus]